LSTRHGALIASRLDRPQSSGVCTGVTFAYSYMITNRATPFATTQPDIVPAAPGSLTFFTAAGAYQTSNPQQSYEEVTQDVFLTRLKADLALARRAARSTRGSTSTGSPTSSPTRSPVETRLRSQCPLVARPDRVLVAELRLATPRPSTRRTPPPRPLMPQTSGSIRDNILGSRQSFDALVQPWSRSSLRRNAGRAVVLTPRATTTC
jgi:hypothetical protein